MLRKREKLIACKVGVLRHCGVESHLMPPKSGLRTDSITCKACTPHTGTLLSMPRCLVQDRRLVLVHMVSWITTDHA